MWGIGLYYLLESLIKLFYQSVCGFNFRHRRLPVRGFSRHCPVLNALLQKFFYVTGGISKAARIFFFNSRHIVDCAFINMARHRFTADHAEGGLWIILWHVALPNIRPLFQPNRHLGMARRAYRCRLGRTPYIPNVNASGE